MINIKENEDLNKLNHSCAHLLAQAVKHLYPNAKFWVGPVIEEGFYYDIDLGDEVIKEEDLPRIEKEMKKIAKDGKRIVRHELTKEEAKEHPKKNVLMKALGANDPVEIDVFDCDMEIDEILLCSDGLTNMLENDQIERVLLGDSGPKEKVEKLIIKANNRGGTDNISIAYLVREEGEL